MTLESELSRIADGLDRLANIFERAYTHSTGEPAVRPGPAVNPKASTEESVDDADFTEPTDETPPPAETAPKKRGRPPLKDKPVAQESKPAEKPAATPTADAKKSATMEDVRAAMAKVQNASTAARAFKLLTTRGARTIKELPVEKYQEVIDAAAKELQAIEAEKETSDEE